MRIYVVEDNEPIRTSLSQLLATRARDVRWFRTGNDFLERADRLDPGCVILDLCLPDLDGLRLQSMLTGNAANKFEIIMISGPCDVCDAVAAMRGGAVDFFEMPYRRSEMLDAITRADLRLQEKAARIRGCAKDRQLFGKLTEREFMVLRASANGESSKLVAHALGLSPRTVEMHRSNILKKLGVNTFSVALVQAESAHLLNT